MFHFTVKYNTFVYFFRIVARVRKFKIIDISYCVILLKILLLL